MVTKVAPKQFASWSFTRYSDYRKCPAYARYKHLDKLPEPKGPALDRGIAIHKLAEDYTNGALKKMPAELAKFKANFAALKKQKVKTVEESWTFKSDWTETVWNDWNGAWLRVKLDVAYINVDHNALVVIDHKTGKYRDNKNAEYEEQLELYGLTGLLRHPTVAVVSPRLWYLDEGITYPNPEEREIEFFRKDEKPLRKKWEAKVKPMFADRAFKPTPGAACQWCHYAKSKGGPCKY